MSLTCRARNTQLHPFSVLWGSGHGPGILPGLAHRVRAIADKADPFTGRRLLDLAKRYDENLACSAYAILSRTINQQLPSRCSGCNRKRHSGMFAAFRPLRPH